jgi:lipopolysaccharide/colanic/teichoic acid biosynthesis glycosyltransferase
MPSPRLRLPYTVPPATDRRGARAVKAALDRILAVLLLVLLSPLLLLLAIWIVLDDGWPVLFRQLRVGRGGSIFRMLKYRSMVRDAVEIGERMDLPDGKYGIAKNDPRITRSGRFLRRTSLDELPQLVNVALGQMSLVGPRPDLVEQAVLYEEPEKRRLAVRPGITGLAQVRGRDEIGWPERFGYDLEYIDRWTLGLDLKVLAMTVSQLWRDEPAPVVDAMNIERQNKLTEEHGEQGTDGA